MIPGLMSRKKQIIPALKLLTAKAKGPQMTQIIANLAEISDRL